MNVTLANMMEALKKTLQSSKLGIDIKTLVQEDVSKDTMKLKSKLKTKLTNLKVITEETQEYVDKITK